MKFFKKTYKTRQDYIQDPLTPQEYEQILALQARDIRVAKRIAGCWILIFLMPMAGLLYWGPSQAFGEFFKALLPVLLVAMAVRHLTLNSMGTACIEIEGKRFGALSGFGRTPGNGKENMFSGREITSITTPEGSPQHTLMHKIVAMGRPIIRFEEKLLLSHL